ncbi:MAG TPA: MgtC/SapB family protein [Thermoanaerobaculia bacterium]|jgi:putative Mg2+ transporter-C (MgtC) family protein
MNPGWQILGEVAIAMALGGVIGLEREFADKPAGLRTHMLIAGAAALLVGLGDTMIRRFPLAGDLVRADPIRVIEAVVTAVGFLGAGMIIRRGGDHIEGLTTAASVLFAAAIGICVALTEYLLAVGVTFLDLATLRGIKPLEAWLRRRRSAPPAS